MTNTQESGFNGGGGGGGVGIGGGGNGAGDCQQNLLTLGRSWTLGVIRGLLITPPAIQEFW